MHRERADEDGVLLEGTLQGFAETGPPGRVEGVDPTGIDGPSTRIDDASTGIVGPSTGNDGALTGIDGALTGIDGASTGIDGASTGIDGASTGIDGASTDIDGASTATDRARSGSDATSTDIVLPEIANRSICGHRECLFVRHRCLFPAESLIRRRPSLPV